MGMEFRLFDSHKGECFDLGKSGFGFSKLFPRSKAGCRHLFKVDASKHDLYIKILSHVAYQFDESMTLEFFKRMAQKIKDWCGDSDTIELWEDQSWQEYFSKKEGIFCGDLHKKYPVTSSIYTDSTEEGSE